MTKRIIYTGLTIIWMITIFIFSNQTAQISTDKSNSFIRNTIVKIYKIFNNNKTEDEINKIVEKYDHPVRKTAHLIEYFILGTLVYLTLRSYDIKNIYIMIIICVLYACSDEFHQLFVTGRSGEIKDVLIDSAGSISAIILFNIIKK